MRKKWTQNKKINVKQNFKTRLTNDQLFISQPPPPKKKYKNAKTHKCFIISKIVISFIFYWGSSDYLE